MANQHSSIVSDLWSSLESLACIRSYEPHSFLFERGERVEGIYLVRKGKVRVWIPGQPTLLIQADPAGPGTMLGLSEAIAQETHKVSAEALVRTEADFVGADTLLSHLRKHQAVCMQVLGVLSDDLHELYHRYQTLKEVHPRPGRRPGANSRPM